MQVRIPGVANKNHQAFNLVLLHCMRRRIAPLHCACTGNWRHFVEVLNYLMPPIARHLSPSWFLLMDSAQHIPPEAGMVEQFHPGRTP